MNFLLRLIVTICLVGFFVPVGFGQPQIPNLPTTPPPPPATKLEGFKPAAGSVVTMGYDELGTFSGVSVESRELRSSDGSLVRGLVVQVTLNEYREDRSFVDEDEISELLKGIDALLEIQANPTKFRDFEVRYETRGELLITAFSSTSALTSKKSISYAVSAGRVVGARRYLAVEDLRKLRDAIARGKDKLASLSTKSSDGVPAAQGQ